MCMMRIGVISAQKKNEKKTLFKRYKISQETVGSLFEAVIAEVPYSEEKLKRLSPARAETVIGTAKRLLEKSKVDKIIFLSELKEYQENNEQNKFLLARKKLFAEIAPECIRKNAPQKKIVLPECEICIRDSEWGRITESLLTELCFDARRLSVVTSKNEMAEAFAKVFFEEHGLKISVLRDIGDSSAEIVADFDFQKVTIDGDSVFDSETFFFEIHGFSVNLFEIAAFAERTDWILENSLYLLNKKS